MSALAAERNVRSTEGARAAFPYVALVAAVALGAVAFTPGVRDMLGRWLEEDSYYGHGPLVPFVSAWIVWRERERLRGIPRGSSAMGLLAVAIAVLVLSGSLVEDVHFTQNFALLLAIAGTALVFLGVPVVRQLWFAFAYLALMVPLPQVLIADLTFALKMLAAKLSVGAIEAAGFAVVLEGSTIHLANASLTVDDVCSGLRTLIALLSIALVFAYLEPGRLKPALMLVLAVPIAIVANVARILVLAVLASYGSSAAHEGPGHEATGLAVYAIALLLFSAVRALPIGSAEEDAETGGAGTGEAGAPPPAHVAPSRLRLAVLLLLLSCGTAAAAAFGFSAPTVKKTERTRAIPKDAAGWMGTDIPVDRRTFALLGTEDVLVRRFTRRGDAAPVDLYVVHANDSRKVAHPPEICFSGGGFVAREHGTTTFTVGPRQVPAIRMLMDHQGASLLVYYWYRIDGRETANYLEHQLTSLTRRLTRRSHEASMIRVSTALDRRGLEAAEARLRAFGTDALEGLLGSLP